MGPIKIRSKHVYAAAYSPDTSNVATGRMDENAIIYLGYQDRQAAPQSSKIIQFTAWHGI